MSISKIKRYVTVKELSSSMHTLCDEWDHRDLETECYGGNAFVEKLSPLSRQLVEDGDIVCFFNDNNQVVKILRKRNPEYTSSTDFSLSEDVDADGKYIQVTEEEKDKELGITHDPEDVYEACADSLESYSESSTDTEDDNIATGHVPMDKWDLLFDATDADSKWEYFIQDLNTEYQRGNITKHQVQQQIQQFVDNNTYSADIFVQKQKKVFRKHVVEPLLNKLQTGVLSTRDLYNICNPDDVWKKRSKRLAAQNTAHAKLLLQKERLHRIDITRPRVLDKINTYESSLKAARQEQILLKKEYIKTKNSSLLDDIRELQNIIKEEEAMLKSIKHKRDNKKARLQLSPTEKDYIWGKILPKLPKYKLRIKLQNKYTKIIQPNINKINEAFRNREITMNERNKYINILKNKVNEHVEKILDK